MLGKDADYFQELQTQTGWGRTLYGFAALVSLLNLVGLPLMSGVVRAYYRQYLRNLVVMRVGS